MKRFLSLLLLGVATAIGARAQSVTITSPTAGSSLTGPVTVTGTTSGFTSTATGNVTVTANGATVGTAAVVGNTTWSVTWTPTVIGDYWIGTGLLG